MNKTKTSRLWSAFVCTGLLFGVVHTADSGDSAMIQIPLEYADIVLGALEDALALRAPRPGVDPSDPAFPVAACDSTELALIAACVCAIKNQLKSCCSVIDDIDSKIDILLTSTCGGGSCNLTPVITQLDACCSVIDNIDSKVDILLTQTVSCDLTLVITQLDACCSVIDNIDSKVDILLTQTVSCDLTLIESQLDQCCSIIENTIGNLGDGGSCFPVIATQAGIDGANLDVIQWLKTLMFELRGVC